MLGGGAYLHLPALLTVRLQSSRDTETTFMASVILAITHTMLLGIASTECPHVRAACRAVLEH